MANDSDHSVLDMQPLQRQLEQRAIKIFWDLGVGTWEDQVSIARRLENMILDVKNVKKKKIIEEIIQSQKGSLDKFVLKEGPSSLDNEHIDINLDDACVDANENPTMVNLVGTLNDSHEDLATSNDVPDINANNASNDGPDATNGNDATNVDDVFVHFDIFDPRNWDALDSKMIDVLVAKGPKRDLSVQKGPKDKLSKRFL
ncbi:uncharacterized protein LOC112521769 [Cynara cardunculus var. scolymus]|uniref:uncharacterized protein LOC112521769 n=1 Tax=Cynara cardunculus var. scolymus TaxID=59895 RepID=UPI000D62890F|nr:uncharacterized protein LOC112521769 [Cynara cardunculus var. scolymus]